MTKQNPMSEKAQALVDEFAKKLADLMLEEGVSHEEIGRIDERVQPLVQRIGNKTTENIANKKVDLAVKENVAMGLKVHHRNTIHYEYIFGVVAIESPYLWKKECYSIRPTTELFGLTSGRSDLVRRALTDFGIEESFENASKRFDEHYKWKIGKTSIMKIVEDEGLRAEKFVAKKLEDKLVTYETSTSFEAPKNEILIELDGCLIRTGTLKLSMRKGLTPKRRNPIRVRITEWKDVRDGFARPINNKTPICVSGLKSYPEIVRELLGAACLVGLTDKTMVVGVTDGGAGLSEELAVQMPNFIHILDKPHLASHLNETAEEAGKTQSQREDWVREKLKQCDVGAAEKVIDECEKHRGRGKRRATRMSKYLTKFKASVGYDAFVAKGYPVGSGEGESLHRSLSQKRMKLPGAWWHVRNVNPMLALRVIRQNGWWDEFWVEKPKFHQRNQPIAIS